MLPPFNYILQS